MIKAGKESCREKSQNRKKEKVSKIKKKSDDCKSYYLS